MALEALEIVSFPINSMVIFHSYVTHMLHVWYIYLHLGDFWGKS